MSEKVSIPDFNLNHPKNYLGYTIAVDLADSAEERNNLMEEEVGGKKINGEIEGSRSGAIELGLVTSKKDTEKITEKGRRVVNVASSECGGGSAALDDFRSLYRKESRFVETLPEWKSITQEIVLSHPGISYFVTLLQEINGDRSDVELPLPLLVQELYHRDQGFTERAFIAKEKRDSLTTVSLQPQGSTSTPDELYNRELYRSTVVHRFKTLLWHAGILTTKGRDRAKLEFSEESDKFLWGLEPAFREKSTLVEWGEQSPTEQPDIEEQARDARPPQRVETTTSRIIRNTDLVKVLKNEYSYCCQVCGDQRNLGEDRYYAEAHHLHPLGDDGPDRRENIIILCPNCHVDFDYGVVTVDPETYAVSHPYDSPIDEGELTVQGSDTVGATYIEYHNREIADSRTASESGRPLDD